MTKTGAAPAGAAHPRWVLVAAIVASSMSFVDGTLVNVALPAIQEELHGSLADMQWVVEAYALLLASLLLVGGSLGDHFGRRLVFMIGVVVFTLASVGCALAPGIEWLVAARAVQGIGAALLTPGSLALISAAYPAKTRGAAIGTWSGWSAMSAAIGPVIGGALVDHASWRWAFLINVPAGIAVLAIAWWRVPESRNRSDHGRVDVWGAGLATSALGGLVYALIEAPTRGWGAADVIAALAVGAVASVAFIAVERRVAAPMLPLALFKIRNFSAANVLTLFLYAALGGSLFYLPLELIQVHHYSATAAGGALAPFVVLMFTLSGWAGRLVDRFGPRGPLTIGPAIAAIGFALFAWLGANESYWIGFLPAVLVLGFGMTITVAPLTTTVMNAVSQNLSGVASGVNNAVSRAAGLLAVALFGVVVSSAGSIALGFRWVMALSAMLALLSAISAWLWVETVKPKAKARAA